MLHELFDRASRRHINLNGRVHRTLNRKSLRGRSAVVYHGTLIPNGTEVAIKAFRTMEVEDEAELKRILREVDVWSKLHHQNVVRMFGITTEFDSTISIISEWVPMGDAHAYVQNIENDPRPLLRDVASGLCYLHNHELGPIVHGDPKGLNVLVSSDHRALLTDFGLTTLNDYTFIIICTFGGGSLPWMSPELLEESPLSTASDVWAFGMTALELFTREIPFRLNNVGRVLGSILRRKLPPRPNEESTQFRLTDAWWKICTSCWRSDPSSRPTMKDLLEEVEAAVICEFPSPAQRLVVLINLVNDLEVQFRMEGIMWALSEIITHRRVILSLTPTDHPERFTSLVDLANNLDERYRRNHVEEDLTEAIAVRRAALDVTPPGHSERPILLTGLAGNLYQRFRKQGAMEDLTETITLRRAILEAAPSAEHQVALVGLANNLDERFRKEGAMDDLTEIIIHRRAALELNPSEYLDHLAPLVALANYLDMQFQTGGLSADLEKRVFLLRAISECAPSASPNRSMSLVNLAICLREKYRRLGVSADLEEAIACAQNAVVLCPQEHRELTRECLVNCVELKIKSWIPLVAAVSSGTTHIISNIVNETITTIPLRLLDTETGALCDRDAQMLRFERSASYQGLLLSASMWDSQQFEVQVRKAVSKFFRYAMFSHRWGKGEPLLCDMKGTSVYRLRSTDGVVKLQKFCLLALSQDFSWAWSDTCCIDKGSSAELQEAIGSMFSWYRQSALTIVYLSDVSDAASFTKSVWFKRGWTLQELLASRTVVFYMCNWSPYINSTGSENHKTDDAVLKELQSATGIEEWYLKNFRPGMDNARSRLQWASVRRTTKPEDIAYSLFGIFHLHLPVLYGESSETALGRLLAEIISQSGDVSVLDWVGQRSSFHSCFPATLGPYQTVPCMQSILGDPSDSSDVDMKKVLKLYRAIDRLPLPRFVNRRLALPSFVYQITAVKLLGMLDNPSLHEYEIHASGLEPLQITLSVSLQGSSGDDLPYVFVRPWVPEWFAPGAMDTEDGARMLLERFGQPFRTLLLKALPHNEYERIASDCKITVRAKDLVSIVNSNLQVLEIV